MQFCSLSGWVVICRIIFLADVDCIYIVRSYKLWGWRVTESQTNKTTLSHPLRNQKQKNHVHKILWWGMQVWGSFSVSTQAKKRKEICPLVVGGHQHQDSGHLTLIWFLPLGLIYMSLMPNKFHVMSLCIKHTSASSHLHKDSDQKIFFCRWFKPKFKTLL